MFKWVSNMFDGGNKLVKQAEPLVKRVNALAGEFNRLSDDELRAKSSEFQERYLAAVQAAEDDEKDDFGILQAGEEALLEVMPEAFAVVREAAQRTLGMRHYDVQLIGGYVLHRGNIAEMKTGEGKTMVASLPIYLNALAGRGAHLITVNDYLVKRDARWMGPIYHLLGLTVGILQHETAYIYDPAYVTGDERSDYLRPIPRREAYLADITYGTNNEFGFDYLRDNMATNLALAVQRPLYFAIVDEVDNILIDEARTPLIISGPSRKSTDWYARFAQIARTFTPADYEVDEKRRSITPTDACISKVERELGIANLYEEGETGTLLHADKVHHLEQSLKAQVLFKRDKEYVVEGDGEVVIVDEFTGRKMPGRRYSDGLHEAIEAKEGVRVQKQTVTYATITVQNYFRMYKKLGGMTGTALTEQEEFFKIYQLEVAPIPTNKPVQRQDMADYVYKTEEAKFNAVAEEVQRLHDAGLPVLVGTISIEKSEELGHLLNKRGVPHSVLNAKLHEQEALIVAQAGRPGVVTIATNMAGRGVDILLGGNPERLAMDMLKERRAAINATVSEEEVRKDKRAAQSGELVARPDESEVDISELQYHGFSKEEWEATLAEAKQICAAAREEVIIPRPELENIAGLSVIGTERHEARRIDNQLRGRAGRQGDPGYSRFYISLEDDLMRRFGSDRIAGLMTRFGMGDDMPIESGAVSRAIEGAQTKVEGYNFDTRKHVLQYDDVMNKQRAVIYEDRRRILEATNLRDRVLETIKAELNDIAHSNAFVDTEDKTRNLPQMFAMISQVLPLDIPMINDHQDIWELPPDQLSEALSELAEELYDKKEADEGEEKLRIIERSILLQVIDTLWVDYLTEMEALREGIGLRAYGQKDPLVEYKIEAARMFNGLKADIQSIVARNIFGARIVEQKAPSKKAQHKEEVRQQRQTAPTSSPGQTQRGPKKGKPLPTKQGRAPRSAR